MAENPEQASGPSIKKKVDESWKDSVSRGTEAEAPHVSDDFVPEPNFPFFLSTLGMQAFMAMGELKDPGAPDVKTDLRQVRYLIGIVEMLVEKTKGNLSKEEADLAEGLLYELRMKFVQKSPK